MAVMRLSDVPEEPVVSDTAPEKKTVVMRLGDLESFSNVQVDAGILEVDDSEREAWRSQGPIGWMEQWRRQDKTEMIPFNPESAVKAGKLFFSVNRIQKNEGSEEQRTKDLDLVNGYLRGLEEQRERGFTFGGRIAQGVAYLPGFMGEFLATGGAATAGKLAVRKGAEQVAKKAIEKGALNYTVRAAGLAAGAGVRTAVMPHRVIGNLAERQVNASLEFTEKGIQLADEVREKPHISALKAVGDVWVENFSEVLGPAIGRVSGRVAKGAGKLFPEAISNSLVKVFSKLRPNEDVMKTLSKAGWHGLLEEMGEERVGAFLRAVTGIEDFGAENPDRAFDRVIASIPNGEELLVEAAVLSFPGALGLGASKATELIRSRKQEAGVQEPVLRELSEDEAQEIVDLQPAPEGGEPGKAQPEPSRAVKPPIPEAIPEVPPVPGQPAPEPVPEAEKPIEQRNALAPEAEAPQGMEADYSIAAEKVVTGKALTDSEVQAFPGLQRSQYRLSKVNEAIAEEKKIGRPAILSNLERQRGEILGELGATPEPGKSTSPIKHQVRVQTGQEAVDEDKIYSEKEALNLSLRAQARLSHLLDTMRKQEVGELQEQMKKGISQAGKQTMENVKAVQQELVSILNDSELPSEDKGRFITAVKNIQTPEQLGKALPEIQQKIKQLADRAKRESLRERISNELDTSKVKKQSGKPVGKFTPQLQKILDAAREAVRMKPDQATMALLRNLSLYGDSVPPAEIAFQNRLLSAAAAPDSVSPESLAETLNLIRELKATGRAAVLLKKSAQDQDIEAARLKVLEIITGGKGVSKEGKSQGVKDLSQKAPVIQRTFKTIVGWNDLLDMLSSRDKSSKAEQSFLSQWADVLPEITAEKSGVRQNNERIRAMAEQAYGLKDKELIAKLKENTREVALGNFKFADGSTQTLTFTRDQAIKRWMELKDLTLDETFYDPEGMGYTPEIVAAIEKFLTTEDKAFGQAQLDFYQGYYNSVNKVYRDIYGVDLPSNPNYSPIRRTGFARQSTDGFGEFILDFQTRPSVAPGALKSRVKNTNVIEKQGSSQVLQQHIVEMERFKNWAYKIRELNAVFGDSEVRAAITENYGQKMLSALDLFTRKFVREGADRASRISWVDVMRINYTRSVLAVKPKIAVQQLVGFMAFSEAVPAKDFAVGVADFWKNPGANAKTLMSSEMMKNRYADIDRDIKDAVNSDAYKAYRKSQSLLNSLMLNIQLGDKGAILQGGWTVYRYHRNQGMTHDFAIREFERVANRTQQSGDVSEQSIFQSGGSFAKLLSMFQSNPNQYFRREYAAIRGLASGRMPVAQAAKMIALYHFVLPMLFQFISDGLRPDKERLARAAILGSMNGIFIVGDMLERLASAISGEPDFQNSNIPIFSMADYAVRAIKALKHEDFSFDDFVTAVSNLADMGGAATGLPIKSVIDMASSLGKIYEEDYRNGFFGLMGWSEWSLGIKDGDRGSSVGRRRYAA